MFGLEKRNDNDSPKRFEFDLEKQLKENSSEKKKIFDQIETQINRLKQALREGATSDHFDQYGVLLQAYSACKRVINRTIRG